MPKSNLFSGDFLLSCDNPLPPIPVWNTFLQCHSKNPLQTLHPCEPGSSAAVHMGKTLPVIHQIVMVPYCVNKVNTCIWHVHTSLLQENITLKNKGIVQTVLKMKIPVLPHFRQHDDHTSGGCHICIMPARASMYKGLICTKEHSSCRLQVLINSVKETNLPQERWS